MVVGVGIALAFLPPWLDEPKVEIERLQKLHEQEEKLLDRQLIRQIYAKIQSWDDDSLEVNSFAREILKQISKFKKAILLDLCI